MKRKTSFLLYFCFLGSFIVTSCHRNSCPEDLDLPSKDFIQEYHNYYFSPTNLQKAEKFSIYLDYSNSMKVAFADDKTSQFYNLFINSLKISQVSFFEVASDQILKIEKVDKGDLYKKIKDTKKFILKNAPLDKALDQISRTNGESVFITDGELWENQERDDPWAREGFENWLKAGNSIDFYSTDQTIAGKQRHVFFMFFIPKNLIGNPTSIAENFNYYLQNSVEAKELKFTRFSFSNNKFALKQEYKTEQTGGVNENVELDAESYVNKGKTDNFEYQEYVLGWKDMVKFVRNATDDNGREIKGGDALIRKLYLEANSLEFYKIEEIGIKVFDVAADFEKLKKIKAAQKNKPTFELDEKGKTLLDEKNNPVVKCPGQTDCYDDNGKLSIDTVFKPNVALKEINELFDFDSESFSNNLKNQGRGEIVIKIHQNFNGSQISEENDNLHRIDVYLKKVSPNTSNPNLEKFIWEGRQVQKNRSIYNSVLGALNGANPQGKVVYSFYVKTLPNDYKP